MLSFVVLRDGAIACVAVRVSVGCGCGCAVRWCMDGGDAMGCVRKSVQYVSYR
jgi:hypothetical protein